MFNHRRRAAIERAGRERNCRYVGLDVQKVTIAVSMAAAGGGEARHFGEIANTPEAVAKLARQLKKGDARLSFWQRQAQGAGVHGDRARVGRLHPGDRTSVAATRGAGIRQSPCGNSVCAAEWTVVAEPSNFLGGLRPRNDPRIQSEAAPRRIGCHAVTNTRISD